MPTRFTELSALAEKASSTLKEFRRPYDEEPSPGSVIAGGLKYGAAAAGAAGVIGATKIGYDRFKDRLAGLRSTQAGFTGKSALGQATGALGSLGEDALAGTNAAVRTSRAFVKRGVRTAGGKLATRPGVLGRAGSLLRRGALFLNDPLEKLRELSAKTESTVRELAVVQRNENGQFVRADGSPAHAGDFKTVKGAVAGAAVLGSGLAGHRLIKARGGFRKVLRAAA